MPKLPKSLMICGYKIPIEYVELEDLYGAYLNRKIQIDPRSDEFTQRVTLFHEAIHAALDITGQSNLIGSVVKEESLVKALEAALYPCLSDIAPKNK